MTTQESPTAVFDPRAEREREPWSPARAGRQLVHLLLGIQTDDSPPAGERRPPGARLSGERQEMGGDVLPRFPVVRHGYDCAEVDTYLDDLERDIAELDQELTQLRGHATTQDAIAGELRRIGEQTSSVLIAAHEQQEEILRTAREQADRCVAAATGRASALTAEAEARLRELEAKTEAMQRQRDRLFDEARSISAALAGLVDGSQAAVPDGSEATIPCSVPSG